MFTDLTAFLTAKAAAGLSPATLIWYDKFVRRYIVFAHEQCVDTKKPETVEAFLAHMRASDVSAFTVSGCYRALSVYYKWLVRRGKLAHSPMLAVQTPRLPKQRKRHVTYSQFCRLYDSIEGDTWLDARDRAALLLLYYSGLRANELLTLQLHHVDYERNMLIVMAGKGNKDRNVPCADSALEQLRHYLAMRPPTTSKRLFVAASKRGMVEVSGPLTFSGLTQMVRRRCKRAGLPRFGLHQFRHGYAMLFLNEGKMELGAVSATLGHSSVEITRRFYADYSSNSLRERYQDALERISEPTGS